MTGIKNKLKSRRGESIAEVLVALLISAVALTMLASMVVSAANMTEKSKKKLEGYYVAVNALENRANTPVYGTVSFENGGNGVRLTKRDVEIGVYDNGMTGEEKIIRYTVRE